MLIEHLGLLFNVAMTLIITVNSFTISERPQHSQFSANFVNDSKRVSLRSFKEGSVMDSESLFANISRSENISVEDSKLISANISRPENNSVKEIKPISANISRPENNSVKDSKPISANISRPENNSVKDSKPISANISRPENNSVKESKPMSANISRPENNSVNKNSDPKSADTSSFDPAMPWGALPDSNNLGAEEWKLAGIMNVSSSQRRTVVRNKLQKHMAYMFEENLLGKTMLQGSAEAVSKIARDVILANLWTLKKMVVPNEVKLAMWKVIKGNRSSKYLTQPEIKRLDSLIYALPQNDLFDLNMSNWDIVRQLGNTKGFTRKQLGVLSYSLKRAWRNDNILQSVQVIDQIKGLICGFPPHELALIPSKTFLAINSTVFLYLTGCTPHQMSTLLGIATKPSVYGPIGAWSKTHVQNIGLLIADMTNEQLHLIRPRAIPGIVVDVMIQMTVDQLKNLLKKQVGAFKGDVLAMYRDRSHDTNVSDLAPSLLPSRLVIIVSLFTILLLLDNKY